MCGRTAPARPVAPDSRLGGADRRKRGAGHTLRRVERLLGRGLAATADAWPAIRAVYAEVHHAAHLLANHDEQPGALLAADYHALVETMTAQHGDGPLAAAVAHFVKVTASYAPGLFHCYDVDDLPRTNNELEHFFGSARYHERRATGRRNASPGLVVRGAVRLVAAIVTPLQPVSADDLRPRDLAAWQHVRQQMRERQLSRRAQSHFRKDPATYLATLEATLLMPSLPP